MDRYTAIVERISAVVKKAGIDTDFRNELVGIAYEFQYEHLPTVSKRVYEVALEDLLENRYVQDLIITGLVLDDLANYNSLAIELNGNDTDKYFLRMMKKDDGLYMVDEVIAMGIAEAGGKLATTLFGYFDVKKPDYIAKLEQRSALVGNSTTYLDDILLALIAGMISMVVVENPKALTFKGGTIL